VFNSPDANQCVAYQGAYTGAYYVLTLHHGRFVYAGPNDNYALSQAAWVARAKGWIN
jgi:hypothetical protein